MSNRYEAGSPNRREEGTPRRMPRFSERGGSHKQVLRLYVRDNWRTIREKVLGGEFSGDNFPRGFRTLLRNHLESEITLDEKEVCECLK